MRLESYMKYFLFLSLLINSTSLYAGPNKSSGTSKEHQVQQILHDLEELNEDDIQAIKQEVSNRIQKHFDLKRSKRLSKILLEIHRVGKVKIENCNDLDVTSQSADIEVFRQQLLNYCQQSLKGFWASLEADGTLRFSSDMSNSNNSETFNIGGSAEFSVSYRGHELLLRGNINDNEVGKTDSESFKRKFNSRIDYSVDIAIRNIETFLMWHLDQEDAVTTKLDEVTNSGFQRQIVASGLRFAYEQKDFIDFKLGIGGGYSFRDAYGTTTSPVFSTWSPSVIGTLDFAINPTDLLAFTLNGRVQRDLYAGDPSWVASQSVGVEFKFSGISMGSSFSVDWDDYRTNAGAPPLGYSGMFTIGVHLADLIGNAEERKERRRQREREAQIWSRANEYADQELE